VRGQSIFFLRSFQRLHFVTVGRKTSTRLILPGIGGDEPGSLAALVDDPDRSDLIRKVLVNAYN
jgi:hypothetical protein